MLVTQLCLTLCDPMDYSPPGSSVDGILQARILEWVAIRFSRGSSQSRDWTLVSCIAGRFFTIWATRESRLKDFGKSHFFYSLASYLYSTCYCCFFFPSFLILINCSALSPSIHIFLYFYEILFFFFFISLKLFQNNKFLRNGLVGLFFYLI